MERRDFLRAGAVAGAAIAAGCSRLIAEHARGEGARAFEPPPMKPEPPQRLASRLTFGARPGDLNRIDRLGHAAYVDELLRADNDEQPRLTMLLHRIDVLRVDSETLRDLPHAVVVAQLQQAALLRAVYGENQLLERMVDLWTNHFNVYALKEEGGYRLSGHLIKTLRKHALGSFPEMLKATAKSPSMLSYLDNHINKSGIPNENYARELLELHTMGVDGGYTQRDVMEVARCFTGWTYETRFLNAKGRFHFMADMHDDGAKTVLGQRIPPGGGLQDGERVLEIVSKHPSTAKFVAGKICREFLGSDSVAWTDRLAKTYLETNGEIRAMLLPLLASDELLRSAPIVKRPLDFVASSLRALDAASDCGGPVLQHLEGMGQAPHLWPMPDGYPVKTSAWTGSLLARWNFALALTGNELGGTRVDFDTLLNGSGTARAIEGVLGRNVGGDDPVLTPARSAPAREAVALALCAPEFQWR